FARCIRASCADGQVRNRIPIRDLTRTGTGVFEHPIYVNADVRTIVGHSDVCERPHRNRVGRKAASKPTVDIDFGARTHADEFDYIGGKRGTPRSVAPKVLAYELVVWGVRSDIIG